MSLNWEVDLKRLEKQLYLLNPSLHKCSEKGKGKIRTKLYNQLQISEPKVALEKYHVHKILVNIEKNFQKCKDFGIIQTSIEENEEILKQNKLPNLRVINLSEQSDDEESVCPVMQSTRQSPDQSAESFVSNAFPLTIGKESNQLHTFNVDGNDSSKSEILYSRTRKRCHSTVSNEPTGHVKVNKYDNDTQVTLTISLPSILKESVDNSLEISVDFGKIDLVRKVLNQKIRSISENDTSINNSDTNCGTTIRRNSQQNSEEQKSIDDEIALSRLISEVLVEPNCAETLRATTSLVNINNNVSENYNSGISADHTQLSIGTNENSNIGEYWVKKKSKKRSKKGRNAIVLKSTPKKRGRKPKQKYGNEVVTRKSDLAKYVELFSNNCELPCTTAPTTFSSSISQVVKSTSANQNYEPSNRTANENQTAQISYLINGEWTNGGICQLIPSSNVVNIGLDTGNINQEDFSLNTPFEDFVNYIDSSNNDVGNNEIARVLNDNSTTAPHIVSNRNRLVGSHERMTGRTTSTSYLKKSVPPPAHNIEGGILDLSLKSELFDSGIIDESKSIESDNCEPVDLSMKTSNKNENQSRDRGKVLVEEEEESDEVFLRRLINDSGFDYKDDNCNQNCGDSSRQNDSIFGSILHGNESFKAALDMPLLDNDECAPSVRENGVELQECDKLPVKPNDFTKNREGFSLGEFTQNSRLVIGRDMGIKEPPRSDQIELEDVSRVENAQNNQSQDFISPSGNRYTQDLNSTNLISLYSTQTGIDHLQLTEIDPLKIEKSWNIADKIKFNFSKPPLMSLISKPEQHSKKNEIVNGDNVSKITEKSVKCANDQRTLSLVEDIDINKVANSISNQSKEEIGDGNIYTNMNDKSSQNKTDKCKLILPRSNEVIICANSSIDNMEICEKTSIDIQIDDDGEFQDNLIKKLPSKVVDLETLDIVIDKHINDVNQYSNSVNVQLESEIDNNAIQAVENNCNTNDKSIEIEAIANVNQMNITNSNENVEHPIEVEFEYIPEKEEPKQNFYKLDEASEQSANVEHNPTDLCFPNQANKKVEILSEETLNSNGESEFSNECSLPENKQIIDLSKCNKSATHTEDVNLSSENKCNDTIVNNNDKTENKKNKPASKLQIISIVSIDSFKHANDDDNEFIRRILKRDLNVNSKMEEFTNSNIQISTRMEDANIEEIMLKQSKDWLKVEAGVTEDTSGIVKGEMQTTTIVPSNTINHYEVGVKNDFEPVIVMKSETVDENMINKTETNFAKNESETKELLKRIENPKLKNELRNESEQSFNLLDELKEKESDLTLSQKDKIIILSDQSMVEKQNNEFKVDIDIKTINTGDDIAGLPVEEINIEQENIRCGKQSIGSNLSCEYDQDSNSNSSLILSKSYLVDIANEHTTLPCSSDSSNESSEELIDHKNNFICSNSDEKKEITEINIRKSPESALETFVLCEAAGEYNAVATVSTDASCIKPNSYSRNLSVLEMEKQFDDSLDFDNHLEDDVLSLATSCFNSPDDDRFDNFKVLDESNDDADGKSIFANCTEVDYPFKPEFVEMRVRAQSIDEEKEIEDKKLAVDPISTTSKFIIPKLNTSKTNQFVLETNDPQPTKKIELDKITRTVQNVCAVPPFPLQAPAISSVPNINTLIQRKHDIFSNEISGVIPLDQKLDCVAFASDVLLHGKNYINLSRGQFAGLGGEAVNRGPAILDIAKIFGTTCLPFLVDKCSVLGNTQHNHQLRNAEVVQVALEGLPKAELNSTYKFMLNHSKLFRRYFFVYCSVYAKQNNRSKLLSMVNDCEKHFGCVVLLRNIFYSLIECGLNKINACRQILSRSRDKSSSTIDVLVGIIFEADWSMFCDYLERFSQIPNYSFRINLLSEMAGSVLRSKDTRLSSVVCKCLLTLNQDDYKLVTRTPNLIALLELMKDGKVC